jgi:cytosol alanyl aminopeptidase
MRWVLIAAASVCVVMAEDPPKLRLDGKVVPRSYALELTIVPEKPEFSANVSIDIDVRDPVSTMWLNAAGLKIRTATLQSADGSRTARVRQEAEFLGLGFDNAIARGAARIHIDYSGLLEEKSGRGLFRRKDGEDWYVATQFEPTDARRAVPCFDEPAYRARWKVTLQVPKESNAFANAPIEAESAGTGGLKVVRLRETAPIPSYLVAVAVGPYETLDAGTVGRNKTPIRIVVPRGRRTQAEFARQFTPRVLVWLEEYFGVPFPFDKLDQIAVPVTYFGAMENVGLITYAESLLLPPKGW